jgi:NADPH:quinone reductase-like Zn-dependent oxidoreductase
VLRPGGILVSLTGLADAARIQSAAAGLRMRAATMLVEPDHAALEHLAGLVEAGRLRPHVAGTFPLDQAARAHEMGETNRTTGKIVLAVHS